MKTKITSGNVQEITEQILSFLFGKKFVVATLTREQANINLFLSKDHTLGGDKKPVFFESCKSPQGLFAKIKICTSHEIIVLEIYEEGSVIKNPFVDFEGQFMGLYRFNMQGKEECFGFIPV